MPDFDENKLFNDVSQAMREDDSSKLSELLAQESPQEEEHPEEEEHTEEASTEEDQSAETTEEESTTEQEEKEDNTQSATADSQTDDKYDRLIKEIAELKKATHSMSSQAGRVPSLQKRLAEYDKRLAELTKTTKARTTEKVKPQIDEALKDLEDTDPVLASTIRKVMEQALTGVDKEVQNAELQQLRTLRDAEYQNYIEEQKTALLSKYPNAMDVFSSKHWKEWKQSQPEHIFNLANSDNADAVSMALDLYRRDMLAKYPELNKQQAQTVAATSAGVTAGDENVQKAAKIEEERKQRQATAANVSSGKVAPNKKAPSDPETLFKQYSETIRKELLGG